MKNILLIILTVFSLNITNVVAEEITNQELNNQISLTANTTAVAKIGDTNYSTLDEAIKAATDKDTILLLENIDVPKIIIDKKVTIDANNKEIKTTYLNVTGKLTLKNGKLNITNSNEWAVMMNNKNALFEVINSNVTITGRGIYSAPNATITLDNTNFTLKDIAYVAWMQGDYSYQYAKLNITNGSTFTISNVKKTNGGGNGLNWVNTTIDKSKLIIENCEYQGIVGGSLIVKNNGKATIKNASYAHTMYRNDEINIDGTSSLIISEIRASGIWAWGGKITFQKGSNVNLTNNGNSEENASDSFENLRTSLSSSVIYLTTKGKTELNIEDGANVNITNNYMRAIANNGVAYIGSNTKITNNGLINPNSKIRTSTYGGGIFNAGSLTINKNVDLYNNHAELAADDIYNYQGAVIDFNDVKDNWILDDCNDKINYWYDDSENSRWNAHDDNLHIVKIESGKLETNLEIKAAHNLKAKVIAHYVDQDGNTLSEDTEINGYVDDIYKTIKKDITGYELNRIEGNETGNMTLETIHVTYVYEFVHGTGDVDEPVITPNPEPEIPYTGIEEDNDNNLTNIVLMSSSLSSLIILIALRKKLI